jgi:iron complex outermembrane receptor protein
MNINEPIRSYLNKMKRLFELTIMLFIAFSSHSQECNISIKGIVSDSHTAEFIPFALVKTSNGVSAYSDANGVFLIDNICHGKMTLTILPCAGCDKISCNIDLQNDTIIYFSSEIHEIDLEQVDIEAYRFRKESQSRMVIETNDISKVQGITLGEQLSRIPGVTTLNTGGSISKPVINGMYSNRIVVINNGIRQEGQQWGSEHAPEIDPNLAERLEVIQGASGLAYGPDAIGGVVIVSPRELPYLRNTSGWVKLNGISNGMGVGGSVLLSGSLLKSKKIAYRINGSGKFMGTQNSPDYLVKNTGLNEYSFSGAIGYQGSRIEADVFYSQFTTNIGIFTGSHIGNLTDLEAAFNSSIPKDTGVFTYHIANPRQFIQHNISKIKLVYHWNDKVTTKVVYGYQFNLRQEYDLHKAYNDSIAALNLPAFELNLWTNSLDIKTDIQHVKFFKSSFGLSGLEQKNAYSGRFFIPNFKKIQVGAFYIGSIDKKTWHFDFGARYDVSFLSVFVYNKNVLTNPQRIFHNPSASIGASKMLGKHWMMSLNLGTAWRPPSINELFSDGLHHGAAAIEVGDSLIRKEVVYNGQLNTQYKSRFANVDISLFYNYFDGYINLKPSLPSQLTIVGAFPVFKYEQSTVALYGLNAQLSIPFANYFNYEINGSLLIASHLENGDPVYGVPANRINQAIKFSHSLWNNKWNAFVELSGKYVFQQKRYLEGSDYVAPPKGYFLLGGQLGIKRKTKSKEEMQLVISCSNILNTKYRDYMNRFRYFTDDIGRNWTVKLFLPINFKAYKNK